MEFSEEWKSISQISTSFNPPLQISNPKTLGPLNFNPNPKALIQLFSSPSLSPPPSLSPHISISRLLTNSLSFPPSLSSSLSHSFSPEDSISSPQLSNPNNILQLLSIRDTVLVLFATGANWDQIGFVELIVNDSGVVARGNGDGDIFTSKKKLKHRIVKISISAMDDCLVGGKSKIVAYLSVATMCSVHWFSVNVDKKRKFSLAYLDGCLFKGSVVVTASWSPHLVEESVVLLENGALFLFDVNSVSELGELKKTRLGVSFDDLGKGKFLGCDFSWHPRILIVACSDAVYLVDHRFGHCKATCVASVGLVGGNQFVAFSKAGPDDGFYFAVASNRVLLLYDIRKPLKPILQWNHVIYDPYYLNVFSLSELRSHSQDDSYDGASEAGFGIIMGSFWHCEFSVFCYGPCLPALRGSLSSKVAKFYNSLYAWELPSELSLLGRECHCGSCITRDEFLKKSLPEWTHWQQKKEIVLGFGILDKNVFKRFSAQEKFGGFTLIRLVSSGKLELQRYYASCDCGIVTKEPHTHASVQLENYFLHSMDGEDYKFPKRFKYLGLDYLNAFLTGKLATVLDSSLLKPCKGPKEKNSFSANFHEILCGKLKDCGIFRSGTPSIISNILKDTSLPTSIHEVALMRMWTGLSTNILQLAFSGYDELLEVLLDKKEMSLEFLAVPDQLQLPPFFLREPSMRSNKWSSKVKKPRGGSEEDVGCKNLVGPVLPLSVLHALHDIRDGYLNFQGTNTSGFETQLDIYCKEVKQDAIEMAVFDSGPNEHAVSLSGDSEPFWGVSRKSKPLFLYYLHRPSDKGDDLVSDHSDFKDNRFDTLISKRRVHNPMDKEKTVGLELFDDLCPVELKFDVNDKVFEPNQLQSFKLLKNQFSRWQEGFDSYNDFCHQSKLQKPK